MRHPHLRVEFAAVFVFLALLTGCSSIPFLGPGSFELNISSDVPSEISSVFVIVGDDADVDISNPRKMSDIVRPANQRKYRTFAQFDPTETDGVWSWRERAMKPTHVNVTCGPSEEGLNLILKLNRKIFEARPDTCVVVAALYSNREWRAEKVPASVLQQVGDGQVVIEAAALPLSTQ